MNLTLEKVTSIVAEFAAKAHGSAIEEIQPETPLLRDGYLDSFDLNPLIVELEKGLGLSLPAGTLFPEDFETSAILYQRLKDQA